MLSRLYIRNYGLIGEINQSFEPGLNTITGETGAGKSMIIGALGLILGDRADAKALSNPDEKCVLEAEFIASESLKDFFITNDLDWDIPLMIRREISSNGRSRAFVNDSPVKLELLKKLNTELIDIHTQDHTLKINSPDYQRYLLDLFANCNEKLNKYQVVFLEYNHLISELKSFEAQIEKDKSEFEFLSFQFNELKTANIKIGELDELEIERELLANRETIKNSLEKGQFLITDSDSNVTDILQSLSSDFNNLKGISDWLNDYYERLERVYQEIKDLGYEFTARAEGMSVEGGELEQIEERLATYYRLEKKYKVKGGAALLKLQEDLDLKLNEVENYEVELNKKKAQIKVVFEALIKSGETLNQSRKKAAPGFEKQIEKNLKLLGITHPKVFYDFNKQENPDLNGLYHVELMFSSNPDSEPDKVEIVASGGEKSRLMLVMKSILGQQLNIKSIVFDEIDSGISGEVAIRTGELLEKLGNDTQVISITHLSQVASKGEHQYKVTKHVVNNKTKISITKLNNNQRVEELAEMISGKEITEAARKTAREMLG
jgi:DNA repair protein RecN (Recombination protein N)